MSAAAQIKFTQNSVSNTAGQAMTGVVNLAVTVANFLDNASITNWQFFILDVSMAGSTLTAGSKQNGSTPTWSFTPDKDTGMVFVQLITTASDGTVASDMMCFGIPNAITGKMHPAFGAMARHVNFGGQTRGWADGDTDTTSKMVGAYLTGLDPAEAQGTLTGPSASAVLTFPLAAGVTVASFICEARVVSRTGGSEAVGDGYATKSSAAWQSVGGVATMLTLVQSQPFEAAAASMAGTTFTPSASGDNAIFTVETNSTINAATVVVYQVTLKDVVTL